MGVVVTPFPTAMLATQLGTGTQAASAAAVVYGLVMLPISAGFNAIWQYLTAPVQPSPGS
jgi:hypothetical protein